jgi:hypothetical protein
VTAGETPSAAESDLDLRATAAHESGHAVIGLVYGLPMRRAVLYAGLGAFVTFLDAPFALEGVSESIVAMDLDDVTRRPVRISRSWDLAAYLVMSEAGEASASHVRGRRTDGVWQDRYETEHVLAAAMQRAPYSAEVQFMIAGIVRAAEAAVRVHWLWIQAVADALMERRVLSAADVLACRPGGERR